MMNNLYKEEYGIKIAKEKKTIILFIVLSCAFLVGITLLFVLLANYYNKRIYQILLAVLDTLDAFCLIYLSCRALYLNRLLYEFNAIKEEKGIMVDGKVESIAKIPITLADKSRVYEVYVTFDMGGKMYYLSEIFDIELEEGCSYHLDIAFDYIRGFEKYED